MLCYCVLRAASHPSLTRNSLTNTEGRRGLQQQLSRACSGHGLGHVHQHPIAEGTPPPDLQLLSSAFDDFSVPAAGGHLCPSTAQTWNAIWNFLKSMEAVYEEWFPCPSQCQALHGWHCAPGTQTPSFSGGTSKMGKQNQPQAAAARHKCSQGLKAKRHSTRGVK